MPWYTPYTRIPAWMNWVVSFIIRCQFRWRGWNRTMETQTTVTIDHDWVWININWMWFGAGLFPIQF